MLGGALRVVLVAVFPVIFASMWGWYNIAFLSGLRMFYCKVCV